METTFMFVVVILEYETSTVTKTRVFQQNYSANVCSIIITQTRVLFFSFFIYTFLTGDDFKA